MSRASSVAAPPLGIQERGDFWNRLFPLRRQRYFVFFFLHFFAAAAPFLPFFFAFLHFFCLRVETGVRGETGAVAVQDFSVGATALARGVGPVIAKSAMLLLVSSASF